MDAGHGCHRRLRCVAAALSARAGGPESSLRNGGCAKEEDPRVLAARAARAEGDPQNSRGDIVLPSGRTRDEVIQTRLLCRSHFV